MVVSFVIIEGVLIKSIEYDLISIVVYGIESMSKEVDDDDDELSY